jgi:hypothetical protein
VGGLAAAALPVAGVAALLAGLGIGAYTGSLMGALSQTRDGDERAATREHPVEQPGGPRIAVNVERPGTEPVAVDLLERHGATEVSRAEGEWRDRTWRDYDPRVDETRPAG